MKRCLQDRERSDVAGEHRKKHCCAEAAQEAMFQKTAARSFVTKSIVRSGVARNRQEAPVPRGARGPALLRRPVRPGSWRPAPAPPGKTSQKKRQFREEHSGQFHFVASSSFARPVLPQSVTGKIQRENTRDGSQFPFTGSPLLRSIVPD